MRHSSGRRPCAPCRRRCCCNTARRPFRWSPASNCRRPRTLRSDPYCRNNLRRNRWVLSTVRRSSKARRPQLRRCWCLPCLCWTAHKKRRTPQRRLRDSSPTVRRSFALLAPSQPGLPLSQRRPGPCLARNLSPWALCQEASRHGETSDHDRRDERGRGPSAEPRPTPSPSRQVGNGSPVLARLSAVKLTGSDREEAPRLGRGRVGPNLAQRLSGSDRKEALRLGRGRFRPNLAQRLRERAIVGRSKRGARAQALPHTRDRR